MHAYDISLTQIFMVWHYTLSRPTAHPNAASLTSLRYNMRHVYFYIPVGLLVRIPLAYAC